MMIMTSVRFCSPWSSDVSAPGRLRCSSRRRARTSSCVTPSQTISQSSINRSINRSIDRSINDFSYLYVCTSLCLSTNQTDSSQVHRLCSYHLNHRIELSIIIIIIIMPHRSSLLRTYDAAYCYRPSSVVGGGSSSNTLWPGPRPTSMPSFILIHRTVWPQYTNVSDKQTGQTTVR